ncbi:MAG: amino acid racemase [Burkholderiaceae bacterium]
MKTLGLLGGTSWPSTIAYYRRLNELAQQRLGGFHSASLLLRSVDYHELRSRYDERWAEVPALLERELRALAALGPDAIVLCNNTLHKAYDEIAPRLALPVPFFHAVEVTARAARAAGCARVLLLGTRFTMEDGYYHRGLERAGLSVETPPADERAEIQRVQSELARGVVADAHRQVLREIVGRYRGRVDAAVLGCTELPLALRPGDCALPLLDPTELQCRAAIDFAIR